VLAKLTGFVSHPDVLVRAGAAEGLAVLAPAREEAGAVVEVLERLLGEAAFVDVGVAGESVCGGRLYHWRRERRSPRAAAIDAVFAIGEIAHDDGLLQAMLAEAAIPRAIYGAAAAARCYDIDRWRLAADAAGGAVAEPVIRAVRQRCLAQPRPDDGADGPAVCAAELAEVIRQLSGRHMP
jgi:D-alanine-D-alanine ligase-like ATP-grasp enzyme